MTGRGSTLVQAYRVFFGVLVIVAVVYQLIESTGSAANFFSFFTIQSNIIAAVVLLVGAANLRTCTTRPTWGWEMVRGAAALYMLLTGIIFNTLLTDLSDELQTTVPWVDTTLHKIMPVVMLADLLVVPLTRRITMRDASWWLGYLLVYIVYTMIRGVITDWYPYPFFDPNRDGGYGRVVVFCVVAGIGFFATSWLVLRLVDWRRHQLSPQT